MKTQAQFKIKEFFEKKHQQKKKKRRQQSLKTITPLAETEINFNFSPKPPNSTMSQA